jgi:hypothetical protein
MDSRESATEGTPCLPRPPPADNPAILDRLLTYRENPMIYQIGRIVELAGKRCQEDSATLFTRRRVVPGGGLATPRVGGVTDFRGNGHP